MTSNASSVATNYNYDRFRPVFYDLAAFDGPAVGQPMPELRLWTVEGETRLLSEYAGRTVVLETGSVTCPMYAKGVQAMNQLADQHPDVIFITLYVREAHPGERIGPHSTEAVKRQQAGTVADRLGDGRLVLVDDLNGTAHRALGLLPNMVYVIDPEQRVRFRGDWTEPGAVEAVLSGTATTNDLNREHFPPAKPSPRTAITTLLNGGWAAVYDFVVGFPALMAQHRRADRLNSSGPPRA